MKFEEIQHKENIVANEVDADAAKVSKGANVGRIINKQAIGLQSVGSQAVGALAVGALAFGAVAIGALAIGRLVVGRLTVHRARLRSLDATQTSKPSKSPMSRSFASISICVRGSGAASCPSGSFSSCGSSDTA